MIDDVKIAATGNSKKVMEKLISLYSKADHIYLFIYLIIYKIHLNAPRVVKVHHEEHQPNEPLARLL